jgi:hypothetical protein
MAITVSRGKKIVYNLTGKKVVWRVGGQEWMLQPGEHREVSEKKADALIAKYPSECGLQNPQAVERPVLGHKYVAALENMTFHQICGVVRLLSLDLINNPQNAPAPIVKAMAEQLALGQLTPEEAAVRWDELTSKKPAKGRKDKPKTGKDADEPDGSDDDSEQDDGAGDDLA